MDLFYLLTVRFITWSIYDIVTCGLIIIVKDPFGEV